MRTFLWTCLFLVQAAGAEKTGFVLTGSGWRAEMRQGERTLSFQGTENVIRLIPLDEEGRDIDGLSSWEEVEDGTDSFVGVHAVFASQGEEAEARFLFGKEGAVHVEPGEGLGGIRLELPMEVGILPGRTLEDVLYFPENGQREVPIHLPSEGWFAALLEGKEGMLALTWPQGKQRLSLVANEVEDSALFVQIQLLLSGKPCRLGLLEKEGIWHREGLTPQQLEKDVLLSWKRPFEARWRVQLPIRAETTCPRSFKFQSSRRSPWRPEIGNYVWPVWFEGDRACAHVSKKIPPEQELVIYPVDDHELSLLGFARKAPWSETYIEKGKKVGLPPGEFHAPNVGFNACWGTYFLRRTVYTQGLQTRWKDYLEEHAEYLADRVHMVQARNERYEAFMADLRRVLESWEEQERQDPEVQLYLSAMLEQLRQTEEGHARKMCLFGGKTSKDHREKANLHLARMKELLQTPGPEVYPECEYLIDRFNRLSWGHDEMTGMRFSMNARAFAQSAALECVHIPQAMDYAQEIRNRLREALKGGTHW